VDAIENICFNCVRFRGVNKRAKPKPECKVNSPLDSCEEDFEYRFKRKVADEPVVRSHN